MFPLRSTSLRVKGPPFLPLPSRSCGFESGPLLQGLGCRTAPPGDSLPGLEHTTQRPQSRSHSGRRVLSTTLRGNKESRSSASSSHIYILSLSARCSVSIYGNGLPQLRRQCPTYQGQGWWHDTHVTYRITDQNAPLYFALSLPMNLYCTVLYLVSLRGCACLAPDPGTGFCGGAFQCRKAGARLKGARLHLIILAGSHRAASHRQRRSTRRVQDPLTAP